MEELLFYQEVVGPRIIIVKMEKKNKKHNLKKVQELLKFILTVDDEEIVRSTIESVIEILEEEINN